MAETRPTATAAAKPTTSVQAAKKGNSISWLAPLLCIIIGYINLEVYNRRRQQFHQTRSEWWILASP